MKLNKLLLMAAMGLGLFACSENELEGNGPDSAQAEGTTYVGLKINFNSSSTRATGDQPANTDGSTPPLYDDGEDGNEAEIHDVRIIVTDADGNIQFNDVAKKNTVGNDYIYTFKTTSGMKTFYAVVNGQVLGITGLDGKTGKWNNPKLEVNNKASELAKYDVEPGATQKGFLMSSIEAVEQSIQPDVEINDVLNNGLNNVAITVERVVAKVTMQLANEVSIKEEGATLKELTCQIGNADNLQYNNADSKYTSAGTYLMAYNDNNVRKTNAYYTYPTDNSEDFWTSFSQSSLLTGDVYTLRGTGAIDKARFYCLENTHEDGNYLKGNTTFVRVAAKMTPKAPQKFVKKEGQIVNELGTEPSQPETFYVVTAAPIETAKGAYVLASDLITAYGSEADDITNGVETEDDKKLEAVIAELKTKGYQFTEPYIGGCGYYNVWVNDLKGNGTYLNLAPVFRNDWYDLTITSLTLPGSANPDAGDPGQQIHPDTYVGVKLTVRDWNKVNHNVNLQ